MITSLKCVYIFHIYEDISQNFTDVKKVM